MEGKEKKQFHWANADSQRVMWVHVVNLRLSDKFLEAYLSEINRLQCW